MKLFFVLPFFSSLIAAELQTDLPRELKTVIASYIANPKDFRSFKTINKWLMSSKELADFRTNPEYAGRLIKAISTQSGIPTTVAALLLNNPGAKAWLAHEESLKGADSMVSDIRDWITSNFVNHHDYLITAVENRIPEQIILYVIAREHLVAHKANGLMFAAIEFDNLTVMRALLENGASANASDPMRQNQSALVIASENAQPEIVRLLLEYDVNDKEAVEAWKAAEAMLFAFTPKQIQSSIEIKEILEEHIRNKRPHLVGQLKSLRCEFRTPLSSLRYFIEPR